MNQYEFHDAQPRLHNDVGDRVVQHWQDIPVSFVDFLKEKRRETDKQRSGDMLHVASVPAVFAVKWLSEGLDVYRAPLKDIVKRIKQEGLEDFLVTGKSAT